MEAKSQEGKIIRIPIAAALDLDGIALDIVRRVVRGKEPYVRPEFAGAMIVAKDLSIAVDVVFTHLLRANEQKASLSVRERARRARELEKMSLELRRLPFRWADSEGLIALN